MTKEEMTKTISISVQLGIEQAFKGLGLDPVRHLEDHNFVCGMRKTATTAKRASITAFVTIGIAGLFGLIAYSFKGWLLH